MERRTREWISAGIQARNNGDGGWGEEGKRQLGGGVGYTGAYYSYSFMRREEGQWLRS